MQERDPWWLWVAVPGGLAVLVWLMVMLSRLLERFGIGEHELTTRAGAAALNLQALLEPSKRHVIEAKQAQRKSHDDDGDSPEPGAQV